MRIHLLWLCGSVAMLASCGTTEVTSGGAANLTTDEAGNLHVPDGYRTHYQMLGTWAVAGETGTGAKQLHVVYVSPGAIAARKTAGTYPDGTVLVKEVYGATTAPMTTGTVSHAAKLVGWFVMVRDRKNSHPGNPLWGDGWGWSWFDADKPTKTSSTDYKVDCLTCHEPARRSGMIYEEGYPILRENTS